MHDRGLLPWRLLLRIAAERFHWPPEVFWRATPGELAAAAGLNETPDILTRIQFNELVREFPDMPGERTFNNARSDT